MRQGMREDAEKRFGPMTSTTMTLATTITPHFARGDYIEYKGAGIMTSTHRITQIEGGTLSCRRVGKHEKLRAFWEDEIAWPFVDGLAKLRESEILRMYSGLIFLIILAAIVLLLGGCTPQKSRAAELRDIRKLRGDVVVEEAAVAYWHKRLRPYAFSDSPPAALLDSLGAARARLDLATRDLNRAMR